MLHNNIPAKMSRVFMSHPFLFQNVHQGAKAAVFHQRRIGADAFDIIEPSTPLQTFDAKRPWRRD